MQRYFGSFMNKLTILTKKILKESTNETPPVYTNKLFTH